MTLTSHLLRGATDFTALSAFLDNLILQTNSDGALIRIIDFRDLTYPITLVRGKGIFTSGFFREYDGGMASYPQLRFAIDRTLPSESVYICHEHFSEEDRKKDPYFSDFLPRHNLKWFGGCLIRFTQYGSGYGIARTPNKPHYSDDDKKILESLSPLFMSWSHVFIDSQRQKLIKAAMELALSEPSDFSVCIDATGELLWKTASAEQTLQSIIGLSVRDGSLKPENGTEATTFLTGLSLLARSELKLKSQFSNEAVLASSDGHSYILKMTRVHAEQDEYASTALQGFLITGKATHSRTNMQSPRPGDIGTLSTKELEVTALAALGNRAPEIAVKLGGAKSTIHTL